MIPSLENLKELEILIRFDCSCPNMSEITLNIIIDDWLDTEDQNFKITNTQNSWEFQPWVKVRSDYGQ